MILFYYTKYGNEYISLHFRRKSLCHIYEYFQNKNGFCLLINPIVIQNLTKLFD